MTRQAWSAALLVLGGCTLFDGHELRLTFAGPDVVTDELTVVVEANGFGGTAELLLDGRGVGTVPVDTPVTVDVRGLAEGHHVVEARLRSGREPPRARMPFIVDRGPLRVVAIAPEPGVVPGDEPLVVEIELSESPAGAWAASLRCEGMEIIPVVLKLDGSLLRVTAAPPFPAGCVAALEVQAADVLGHGVSGRVGGDWRLRVVRASAFPDRSATNGAATVTVAPGADPVLGEPPGVEITVAGVPVGNASPPWGPAAIDTASVPEGTHLLALRSPGWGFVVTPPSTLRVDRTPPTVSCRSEDAPGQLSLRGCVRTEESEELVSPAVSVTRDGVPVEGEFTRRWAPTGFCPTSQRPPPPYTESYVVTGADAAGNALAPTTCTFSVPSWIGVGPLTAGGEPVVAAEIALPTSEVPGEVPGRLAWIPPVGAAGAGFVHVAGEGSGPLPNPVVLGRGSASGLSADRVQLGWTERSGSGPGQAHAASWLGLGPTEAAWVEAPLLNLSSRQDAGDITVTDSIGTGLPPLAAWSEPVGGRVVAIRPLRGTGGPVTLAAPAGHVASRPVVAVDTYGSSGGLVAWLDTGPGAPPVVRVAVQPGSDLAFTPVELGLDLDPAEGAESVAAVIGQVGGGWVGWIEGGRVALAPGFFLGAPAGPLVPEILNVDSAARARWLRIVEPGTSPYGVDLAWVESTPDGDRILLRAGAGVPWAEATTVQVGTTGPVLGLALRQGPTVAWIDADGHVWMARPNL
jgi:hypothetical protein